MQDKITLILCTLLCLVAQSCLTLWDPMDCSPSGSSVHGDSPAKNTGVGCHALLQGIFPTQGSNPNLLCCRQILYQLSHQGSSRILEWVACLFSGGSSQESNLGLLHCRWILYQLSYQRSPKRLEKEHQNKRDGEIGKYKLSEMGTLNMK